MSGDLDLTSVELLADVAEDYGLAIDCSPLTSDDLTPTAASSARVSSRLASQIAKSSIPPTDDSLKYNVQTDGNGNYGRYTHYLYLILHA